ncbi:MAG: leucine-rich repeat protein [Desulfosporosinus sp.]|nr:leucine-rich repeat protein [Desulfosporosinus sp.]
MRVLKISKASTFLIGLMMMTILLCCSSQVQADQDGDFTYTVTNNQAQITSYTGAGGVVTTPNTLGGYPVTSIGATAFRGCTGLTSISISQGVTSIGGEASAHGFASFGAFQSCTGLTSISIPQGVTSIGASVFGDCTGLTSISIPQGVTNIGDAAFSGCTGLTTISIPQGVTSIGNAAFYGCIGLASITFNSATTIYDDPTTIPATTTIIGYDPSTAKDYASKYNRMFEDIGGSTKTLQSIAITTPATKLIYNIGDKLDITELIVTGTYSDGSTKVEPITAAYVTGFNSAITATNQVLTITISGQTVAYKVQIVAAPTTANGDIEDTKTGTIYQEADYRSNTKTFDTMINQIIGEDTPNQFTYAYGGNKFNFDDYNAAVTQLIATGETPTQAKADVSEAMLIALSLPSATLEVGELGAPYTASISATGGTPPYSYVASGLPAGLTMGSNGTISGIPKTRGTTSFTVNVTDNATPTARTVSKTFWLTVEIFVKEPVIYLYPTTEQQISVKLNFNGKFTSTFPEYKDDWKVVAHPDGTLLNLRDNKEYPYLIWEGILDNNSWDMAKGFVVAGKDTKDFLQDKLSLMGLTPKEYNDFIVYWLPKMQDNKYNLITFANEEYKQRVLLSIEPNPDSVLRVFMVYKPITEKIDIPSQQLMTFNRTGFSVVEWGGTEI